MKKDVGKAGIGVLALLVVVGFGMHAINIVGAGTGDGGHPAAKATCAVNNITLLNWDAGLTEAPAADGDGWTSILFNTIKTANKKDLFIDVSLECGLYTQTLVRSKGGKKDTSSADACIKVRVVIDGDSANLAYPGEVVFARRRQELSATLEGMIGDALTVDDNNNVVIDPNLVVAEEIELILETMNANSFNFIEDDLEPGVHTIAVQVLIDYPGATNFSDAGAYDSRAMIGKGTVTVEEMSLIMDEDILLVD
jgi:hypothetical protein